MNNKKAQSEIITTVLIILLVLAAIVIVWQVIRQTVEKPAGEIDDSMNCIGVALEVTPIGTDGLIYSIKRTADGPTFEAVDLAVIKDGVTATITEGYTIQGDVDSLNSPLGAITVTFGTAPATSVGAGLKVNGKGCGAEGVYNVA